MGGVHVAEMAFITLLLNDKDFSSHHSDEYTRYIDWNRGKPYTWRKADYEELCKAKGVFARKFSNSVDSDIISMLSEEVLRRKEWQQM